MAGRRFPLDKFPKLLKNPPPNVDIMLYDKKKKGHHPGDNTVNKPTLSHRIDQLEASINRLAKTVDNGFKQVNSRINRIEARLDYNGLKKLPVDSK